MLAASCYTLLLNSDGCNGENLDKTSRHLLPHLPHTHRGRRRAQPHAHARTHAQTHLLQCNAAASLQTAEKLTRTSTLQPRTQTRTRSRACTSQSRSSCGHTSASLTIDQLVGLHLQCDAQSCFFLVCHRVCMCVSPSGPLHFLHAALSLLSSLLLSFWWCCCCRSVCIGWGLYY